MKIIPAIDIMDGKCVRLTKGDFFKKKIYAENPMDVAKSFEDNGLRHLHLVDLDGAKAGRAINLEVLELIAAQTSLQIDFGGGISSLKIIRQVLDAGATKVTIGSMAVTNQTLAKKALELFGADRLILGADIKEGNIAHKGWQEKSSFQPLSFAQHFESLGFQTLISTMISKDGMMDGPDIEWYKLLKENTTLEVIASGGVHSLEDLEDLASIGCSGVIIGKAIYEGAIPLSSLQSFQSC